jgi:hypothetical protein
MEAAVRVAGSRIPDSDGDDRDDASDIDSFVSSFDFSSLTGESDGEESISPTWGLEGGRELQDAVAAAKEEAAHQAAQDDYKPKKSLGESLEEARIRAIEVGVIQDG